MFWTLWRHLIHHLGFLVQNQARMLMKCTTAWIFAICAKLQNYLQKVDFWSDLHGILLLPWQRKNTCSHAHPSWPNVLAEITSGVVSFPDLLWRSGKVRKFAFLDWLLHLTPVQSLLWKFMRFSEANLNVSNVTNMAQSENLQRLIKTCAVFVGTQQIPTRGSRFFRITKKP